MQGDVQHNDSYCSLSIIVQRNLVKSLLRGLKNARLHLTVTRVSPSGELDGVGVYVYSVKYNADNDSNAFFSIFSSISLLFFHKLLHICNVTLQIWSNL